MVARTRAVPIIVVIDCQQKRLSPQDKPPRNLFNPNPGHALSLRTFQSSWGAISPKVWNEGRTLYARTALLWMLLTLFAWRKEVRVNAVSKTILIQWRILWLFKKERAIHFKDISHLDYSFGSMSTAWDWFGNSHDQIESYRVGLVLNNRDEIHLFSFMGEGAINTGLIGVLAGDSLYDIQGDQGDRSLGYIDALRAATNKELSPPSISRSMSRTRYH